MKKTLVSVSFAALILAAAPAGAAGEPDGEAPDEATEEEIDSGRGLNFDLGFATAYVFRGVNVFSDGDQLDPHMLLAPGIRWSIFDTGLWLGYWGAFQLNGDNLSDNIDAGVGIEQDLLLGWDRDLGEAATVSLFLYWYFYPAADKATAGAKVPSYMDPGMALTVRPGVDLAVGISYFAAVQDALSDYRYLYLNPSIGKDFELNERVGLEAKLGYGVKLYHRDSALRDNRHDVQLTVAVPIDIGSGWYLTPGLGAAWTDLAGEPPVVPQQQVVPDPATVRGRPGSRNGYVVWGGLNVGVEL
ncbi:MAG TPA: TorF family putative porin [Polyangia bacterium]|nr:TorF family putative porin [Polyangia bacterium]